LAQRSRLAQEHAEKNAGEATPAPFTGLYGHPDSALRLPADGDAEAPELEVPSVPGTPRDQGRLKMQAEPNNAVSDNAVPLVASHQPLSPDNELPDADGPSCPATPRDQGRLQGPVARVVMDL